MFEFAFRELQILRCIITNNGISFVVEVYQNCIKCISFTKNEQVEIPVNGTMYDFLGDHSSVEKEDILNIHEYLIVKNNIK